MNEAKHPYIRYIPTYTQHVNGCGLSSLLMLVDLPKNIEIREFLDKIWERISGIFGKTSFNQKDLKLAEWKVKNRFDSRRNCSCGSRNCWISI